MSELSVKPAVELIEMLQRGSLSGRELAQEHIWEIERLDPLLHAFVDVDASEVLKAAAETDKLRARLQPKDVPPLLGLPCSIKSSISVAGHLCETGTTLNRGFRPGYDAEVVRLLRQDGAVILGTTNCPEFLMAYETDNLLYGATSNPWSLQHQAGGSSGGESAAIAAGLSALGIGSDSGGSVREPAHFTGICSLKPTPGRISSEGHTLPCVGPFATLGVLGPMARTIADVSLLLDTISASPGEKRQPPSDEELHELPIGVLEDDGNIPVTQETRSAVRAAARALEERGFEVIPFASKLLEPARKLWQDFFVRCGRVLLEPLIRGREDQLSSTFKYFLYFARDQPPITAAELLTAWAQADQLRQALTQELTAYTAIITPVAAIPAFRHGERQWLVDGKPLEYFDAMRFTQWFNLLGAPAAVVPVGWSEDGLPIGVQIASHPHTDETVLSIALLIDQDFGYQPPPMTIGPLHGR